jgi:putative addiction module component (TIGR02574 family)
MSVSLSQLENDLLALPTEMRASLARILIQSLDDDVDIEADALWENEIRRRDAEARAGKKVLKPVEQVVSEVRELLRSMK